MGVGSPSGQGSVLLQGWGPPQPQPPRGPPPLPAAACSADWPTLLPPGTCCCLSWGHPPRAPSVQRAHCGGCGASPCPAPDPRCSDVSMTTRALQELDGGLGSCQAGEDLSTLADPCPDQPQEDRAQAMPRLADSSGWPHVSQAEGSPTSSVDARPKKTEKEPVAKVAPGPGKERLKAGAAPRSPVRKKVQASPPPAPAPSEERPWGDLSLNKCLVLASFVALLGSAFQLCRDAVAGEAEAPAAVPEPWAPPSSAPERASAPLHPKPKAWAPPSGPRAPQVEKEEKAEVPASREGAEKAAGEKRAPKEPPRKGERPRKERPRKEKPRKEVRPREQEKPPAARERRAALPRRWEVREGGRRHGMQDSRDPGHKKSQAWDSPRRPDTDRPPGRQKHRAGKGRD
ncbi:junctional sarcoplasmic reticulum protein 1 [Halichoerus grypus]|uniref:junctional sarcoplasmic reticulum protein 1 n=1 Tax=Halichoerus grypus TaxID=9711 RepID=UPI00165A0D23|nr:junctional sarcoplasmic reticulum protein 1 [Halichoerus grypus]